MKKQLSVWYWTAYAFVHNLHAEWHNRRLENKRRPWRAIKTGGGGLVPLGRVNQEKAIDKVTKFGNLDYVDVEVAVVFYSDKH